MSADAQGAPSILTTYTLFRDVLATRKTERADVEWREFVERIRSTKKTYPNKQACPLISMAEYGDQLSDVGCIRRDENVRRIFGAAIDYDAGLVAIEDAARLLESARIEAVLVTTPSHTAAKPRWRVFSPTGDPEVPEKYREFVGRLNRVLGGVAAPESFALSRSYFIGRVKGVAYQVIETHGRTIDLCTDIEPLYPGQVHVGNGRAAIDPTTDADLRAAFLRGEDRYGSMLKFSSRWAARGMSADDVEANLHALLDSCPGGTLNGDGTDLRTRARPLAESAVRKFGETRRSTAAPIQRAPSATAPSDMLIVRRLSDVNAKPIVPLLPGCLYVGKVTVLAGVPGDGKSLAGADLAARISAGLTWPVGDGKFETGNVLLLTAEDDPADTIRPRLDVAGADTSNIHVIEGSVHVSGTGERTLNLVSLIDDLPLLENLIVEQHTRLLIVDPLSSFADSDTNKTGDMRRLLDGLAQMAARTGVAIIIITHLNKRSDARKAMQMVAGSHVIVAAVRVALVTARDPNDKARRLLLPIKLNIDRDDSGFAFRIVAKPHNVCGEVPTVQWETSRISDISADDALIDQTPRAQAAVERSNEVQDWLRTLLSTGPVEAQSIWRRAAEEKFSQRRVRMAAKALRVLKEVAGYQSNWHWRLPESTKDLTGEKSQ